MLYVVDSVTRQWVDQARKAGQQLGSGAPDGTFAAGVTRVTELLPVLMNDIITSAPEDQKVCFYIHTVVLSRHRDFHCLVDRTREGLRMPPNHDCLLFAPA